MRILIAYEERHHIYSDAVEQLLRRCRPHISVLNVPLNELKDQLKRFDPCLVVCSESNTVDPGGIAAWIELSPEPAAPSKFCLDGEHSEASNPRLAELLTVVDEVEELVQTGGPALQVARGVGCLYSPGCREEVFSENRILWCIYRLLENPRWPFEALCRGEAITLSCASA